MIVVDHEPWHFDVFEPCEKQAQFLADHVDEFKSKIPEGMAASAIEDGKVLAIGGVVVDLGKSTGEVWLVLSEELLARPVALYRTTKNILTTLMKVWDLKTYTVRIDPEDDASINWIEHLGFTLKGSSPNSLKYERLV